MQGGWEEKVVVGRTERVVLSELGGRMSNPAESNHLLPAINTCQTNRNIQNRFQRNATQPRKLQRPSGVAISDLKSQNPEGGH